MSHHFLRVHGRPGTVSRVGLDIGIDGSQVRLPVLLAMGREEGPFAVIVAGQHGDEFDGITAAHQLIDAIDPGDLTGAVAVFPCLNIHGFLAGRRNAPGDEQDMNRLHPGRANGTLSERIIEFLHREALSQATAVLDLHGGSLDLADLPFAVIAQDAPSRAIELADAMGVAYAWVGEHVGLANRLLGAAGRMGIPAIGLEAGGLLGDRNESSRLMRDCAIRWLHGLGILTASPARETKAPIYFRGTPVVAGSGGLFRSEVRLGEHVEAGQRLGIIVDLLGRSIEEIRAPVGGFLPVLRSWPRIRPGETVALVGTRCPRPAGSNESVDGKRVGVEAR